MFEQADDVFALSLVNMIFRGDGKSRIYNGNCFDNEFVRQDGRVLRLKKNDKPDGPIMRPFTRVLMNPPFAITEPESLFVDYALNQMRPGGLLFAVLPNGPVTGSGKDKEWRRDTLKQHTVRAVVKMPDDLFMPNVHKGTYALILEAWRPHKANDDVFFGYLYDDQHATYKSKLLSEGRARDNLGRITDDLARFLRDGRALIVAVPKEICVSTLNMDLSYDFASEAYLGGGMPDLETAPPVEELFVELSRRAVRSPRRPALVPKQTREFEIEALFDVRRGQCPPLKKLADGDIPVVTSSEQSNGIAGYYDVPKDLIESHCVTISANGSTGAGKSFWHPYQFSAVSDALVCSWREGWKVNPAFCLYVCNAISQNSWRFDYFRKSTSARVLADIRIKLPVKGDRVDYKFIDRVMNRMRGFTRLKEMLDV